MIRVESLSKHYGPITACSGVSFEVLPGEVTALAGPNGAGKSTILQILSGVLLPDSGTVALGEFDMGENPAGARSITGTLFENAPLYADLTVFEHLAFVARMYGAGKADAKAAAEKTIAACKLDAVANRGTAGLSRGFRQRVGLALALVHDPEILILDEPTSGLDPIQLEEFRTIIRSLPAAKTVFLSTHVMQEVESLCKRIIIVNRGKVVASGSLPDLCAETGTLSIEEAFLSVLSSKDKALS